jgi:hypothetical protein
MARRFRCPWHGRHEGTVCPKCARETRRDVRVGKANGVNAKPHDCPQHPGYTVRNGVCPSPYH